VTGAIDIFEMVLLHDLIEYEHKGSNYVMN
jgi:hypothetical protein